MGGLPESNPAEHKTRIRLLANSEWEWINECELLPASLFDFGGTKLGSTRLVEVWARPARQGPFLFSCSGCANRESQKNEVALALCIQERLTQRKGAFEDAFVGERVSHIHEYVVEKMCAKIKSGNSLLILLSLYQLLLDFVLWLVGGCGGGWCGGVIGLTNWQGKQQQMSFSSEMSVGQGCAQSVFQNYFKTISFFIFFFGNSAFVSMHFSV